ncbi:hypothetical protein NDN01_05260 [Sphingomonas sp. QA11]|uniref:hypothetical protein n=1 Tax=Sphingomonas sp. QA11 TaxID=2950605 RepID=UPI00234A3E6C|nr:MULTISPECIES: hypothetical protein [unclassified Sphingomonas]WCM28334.1 hypothetical protein NDN01_05260 [Sphingomonas sp. QA11]WEK00719.1 MAG: hypothetical protein P0Y59_03215 [Sphingomonas sp.]
MNAPSTDKSSAAKPTARAAAEKAIETTRDTAREAARRTAEGIEANPLAVLIGGVAIGVLAGAVIPRTEQEGKLLGPVGKRLNDTATGAAQAARDAGKAELDALGLNRDAARDQVGKLIDGVVKALSSAGAAATAKASNK